MDPRRASSRKLYAVPPQAGDEVLLDLIGQVMGLLDLDEFRAGLIEAIRRAVPCTWSSLKEVGPDEAVVLLDPDPGSEWTERLDALARDNPIYRRWERTRDGRPYRLSDVVSREAFEATRLHREVYGPLGIRHQIAFTLPHEADSMLAVELSRDEHDFSDRERELLNRARPFLIQAYRNAIAHSEVRREPPAGLEPALVAYGLTAREAEVVQLVALVASNRGIAERLGISERTVQKHLEHAFRKLDVTTRADAVSRARELASLADRRRIIAPPESGRIAVLKPVVRQIGMEREDDVVVRSRRDDR